MRLRTIFAVAAAGLIGVAVYLPLPFLRGAAAAPTKPRSTQPTARSSSFLIEARSHLHNGRIVQAEVATRRSLATHDSAEGRLLLAQLLVFQGRLLGALEASRQAVALAEPHGGELLASARSLAEQVAGEIPTVRLVGQLPEGARVLLDGNEVGGSEGSRLAQVDPGEHEVEVESPGRARWRARFRAVQGQVREVGVQGGPALSGVELPAKLKLPLMRVEPASPFEQAGRAELGHLSTGLPMATLSLRMTLPGLRPDLRALGLRRSSGRVLLRDCTLVPCPAEADDRPAAISSGASSGDRVDKRLFSEVQHAAGVEVTTSNGFVLVTAPAEAVARHARVGASMMPDGTGYVGLTGKW